MIKEVIIWFFGWLRIRESFVTQAPEFFVIRLKEYGIAPDSIPRHEALLGLAQVAYQRAKNRKGVVRWARYQAALNRMAEDARNFVQHHSLRDKRVEDILQFYSQ